MSEVVNYDIITNVFKDILIDFGLEEHELERVFMAVADGIGDHPGTVLWEDVPYEVREQYR